MKVAWHKSYCHPLPDGHRFPMLKYELLPKQLLLEGVIDQDQLFEPTIATDEQIALAHNDDYIEKLNSINLSRKEERATGFPLNEGLVLREKIITGGTIECIQHALKDGIAFNTAGGTHHAYADHGEGFCLYNDIAVSSLWGLQKKWIKQVLVIDLDVHQGNGTARIFEQDNRVYTFSAHGEKNYPHRKETSDLDLAFEDGTDDQKYLETIDELIPQLIDKVKPDLIHYQCGVDVLASDKLGRLGLSLDACRQRDYIVLSLCHERGIPAVCTMGGGYSPDIKVIVDAHVNTYKVAKDLFC